MIWLTWRQFRVQAAVGALALAALAALLALTGPGLADTYASGLAACGGAEQCETFSEEFFEAHQVAFLGVTALVLGAPALIGLFWGAPLIARELEAGTHRLVWTQGVGRTRWLAAKMAVIGLAATAVAGLGSLAVSWWADPVDSSAAREFPRLSPLLFGTRDIVPVGYAVFAFVLGVTVGMLVRRPLPAMVVTLAVFAAVQVAMPTLVRPHLLPAKETTTAYTADTIGQLVARGPDSPVRVTVDVPDRHAWVLSNQTLDPAGKPVDTVPFTLTSGPCSEGPAPGPEPRRPGPSAKCLAAISDAGYRQRVTYHPSSRYWTFQWIETGIYAGLALGLSGFCVWWLRRRLS